MYDEDELDVIIDKAIEERKMEGIEDRKYRTNDFDKPVLLSRSVIKVLARWMLSSCLKLLWILKKEYLIQVRVEDAEKADAIFNKLMGTEVELRKNFIQTHAKFVKDLDI